MTIKKAIAIGLLTSTVVGLLALGIKFKLINKENTHTQVKAENNLQTLANTTWTFTDETLSQWTTPSITDTHYAVNFTIDNLTPPPVINEIYINNTGLNISRNIYFTSNNDYYLIAEGHIQGSNLPITVTFENGTDIANTDLITWIQSNATQQNTPTINDLTNTSWLFNDTGNITLPTTNSITANINFISNNINFNQIDISTEENEYIAYIRNNTPQYVYTGNNWDEQWYRTITITNGTDVTNSTLINWITSNATQITSFTITPTLSNVTSSNTNYTIDANGTWETTITANDGYMLPQQIEVTNTQYTWNKNTGIITIHDPWGNVTITITAPVYAITQEVIPIHNLMLQILTMPFTFISQAFDVTLWPGTDYAFNIKSFIMGLIAIASILFIIRLFTSGFSILSNYTHSSTDTKLKKSQIEYNKAKTDLAKRTDPNTKTTKIKKEK